MSGQTLFEHVIYLGSPHKGILSQVAQFDGALGRGTVGGRGKLAPRIFDYGSVPLLRGFFMKKERPN